MKITCQSCQSKYTIADEKVLGKIVKIRCKKCSATIVVNGSDGTTTIGTDTDQEPLSRYRPDGLVDGWMVNMGEGVEPRTMSESDVVSAFRVGTITAETFVWKEGMADWVALRESGDLYRACSASPGSGGPDVASNGVSGGFAGAARRAGGRAAGVDLFGGAAKAGGEGEVVTSAPAKIPQPREVDQKPTGARNENSVLFSLNALSSKSEPPPSSNTNEASGLIDIRQLSAQAAVEDKKSSRVDDIMNLTGGGAFSPTLIAPTLTGPAFDAYAPDSETGVGAGGSGIRGKGAILLAVGVGACALVAAIGGFLLWSRDKGTADTVTTTVARSEAVPNAPSPSSAGSAVAEAPSTAAPATAAAAPATAAAAPSAAANPEPESSAKAPPVVAANAPPEKSHEAAPKAAAAPAVAAGPFNMGEAKAKLGAAAASAGGCKRSGGPTGTGRVIVVFAPSGAAQSATVSGPPFEGTSSGACVAARFRAVRVPAFSGSPFSVSKSFNIN
jgi:predicted Zn finger-like uncharacterized protein